MCWLSSYGRAKTVAVLVVLSACLLGMAATTAFAGTLTNWSVQPKGTVVTSLPVIATGTGVRDAYPLVASSLVLKVDGAIVPRSGYTASVSAARAYVYYNPTPALSDGTHTFTVEVKDTANRSSVHSWTASLAQPPTASWRAPAAGQTIFNGWPSISLHLADNTPGTTFTVAGEVRAGSSSGAVVRTFGGTGLTGGVKDFVLSEEIPFGTYALTATVTDAAGNSRTLSGATSRSFTTISLPAMVALQSCDACHSEMRSSHVTPASVDCGVCHPDKLDEHMEGTEYCEDCHTDGWHSQGAGATVAVSGACFDCHNADRPDIPRHTATSAAAAHQSGCLSCHQTSLIAKHAVIPTGSSYAYQCDVCHGSGRPDVSGAIAAGEVSCSQCHATYHSGFEEGHTAVVSTCVEAGCHDSNLLTTQHQPYVGVDGRYPQYPDTCALCHDNLDPDRIPTSATTECATCHPDRVQYHAFDALTHTAADSALSGSWPAPGDNATYNPPYAFSADCSSCHDLLLTDEHAKSTSSSAGQGCSVCHPTPRDSFSEWGRSCTQAGCHALAGTAHEASGASHAMGATDVEAGCGFIGTNGRRPCHYRDIVQEHNRTIVDRINPVTNQPVLKSLSVSCTECHNSDSFTALDGVWNGSCDACHDGTRLQNHSISGSARYNEVYAAHANPAGFYDNGEGNAGTNAMDAHGWVRPNPDQVSANKTIGCGAPTCHTQAFVGGGYPYPSVGCASCHGPSIAVPDPYQGSYSWYTQDWFDYEAMDTMLTATLDPVALPAGSSLDFKTWYDIEKDWDYGYVQVSTDNGATWTNVPGSITTAINPNMANLGNGVTGVSGGWANAHFDLSPYAGQLAMIRFTYYADLNIYGLGWMIDAITVGPPGAPVFEDDCETLKPEWDVETWRYYYDYDLEEWVYEPTNLTGWTRYTR